MKILQMGAVAVAIVAAALLAGDAAMIGPSSSGTTSMWREVEWPFLLDQWGRGRAFQCSAANCEVDINLYLRPKLGFCNCSTGVSDDDELERVGDVDLLSTKFAPLGPGRPVRIGWMSGRSRAYRYAQSPQSALAIAFNDRCDVVVATVVAAQDLPAAAEAAALSFLGGATLLKYVKAELGL
jgi:hypothetical protein